VSAEEAVRIQNDLRGRVKLEDDFGTVSLVAGVDVGYSIAEGTATAAVVVLTFPDLSLVETATATETVEFPYIPGLLSFREAPAILAAFGILTAEPDLLMVDGQGIAHPRRFGIACHIGVLLDKPSIGCGKSRLIGEYSEPGPEPGDSSPLTVKSERVGSVLRTKAGVKPLFISPGNRIGFESADRFVLECVRGYKLPETTRLADRIVSHALPVLATK
jgi:deoxyribonuclease V